MQISVHPIATPNRTGTALIGTADAEGFEDVLNGLPPEPGRTHTAGLGLADLSGAPTSPPLPAGAAPEDAGSEVVLTAEGAVLPAVPLPVLVTKSPDSLLSAQAMPQGVSASPAAAGQAIAVPASPPVASGTVVADQAPTTAIILPETGSPGPQTPTMAAPVVADRLVKPQKAAASATTIAQPKGNSGSLAPKDSAPVLSAPALAQPDAPPATPAPGSAGLPDTSLPPPQRVVAAGIELPPADTPPPTEPGRISVFESIKLPPVTAKPAVPASDAIPPDATSPSTESTIPSLPKSAGQPSLTAAIQMLTRDDIGPTKGAEPGQNTSPTLIQLLRAGYQEDAPPIPASPAKTQAVDAPVVTVVQPTSGATPEPAPTGKYRAEPGETPLLAKSALPSPPAPKSDSAAQGQTAAPPSVIDLGFDKIAAASAPDLPPPTASTQAGAGSAPAAAPMTPTSITPQALGQTIVHVLQKGDERQIDLALKPEELGRLRFEMTTSGDKVHVTLFIERPDAMDLIRRHADQLLSDLRQAGFSQSSLSFGEWSQRDSQAGSGTGTPQPSGDGTEPLGVVPATRFSPVTAFGRLDIRV